MKVHEKIWCEMYKPKIELTKKKEQKQRAQCQYVYEHYKFSKEWRMRVSQFTYLYIIIQIVVENAQVRTSVPYTQSRPKKK